MLRGIFLLAAALAAGSAVAASDVVGTVTILEGEALITRAASRLRAAEGVRLPAAWNGVVGLKVTAGRISTFGVLPLSFTLDTPGPLTRSVEDAALMYAVLNGPDPRDPQTLAWTPDGRWLAVPHREGEDLAEGLFLVSALTGEKRRLTQPPLGDCLKSHDGNEPPPISPTFFTIERRHFKPAGWRGARGAGEQDVWR